MKGKRIEGLDCEAPAEQMIQHVLRAQLKAMCGLRKKALDWSDPEGVHDMRVTSRRFRSAIRDFEPYLRKRALPIARLRAIARSLGAVRDQDVAIAALEKIKSDVQGHVAEGIELLLEERRQRRSEARANLQKAISHAAVAEFREQFENKIRNIGVTQKEPRENAADKASTFAAIGVKVIVGRLRDCRAQSSHIFFPGDNKELHELRILAKRLRYAVELFSACWGDELIRIAKEIALLQTSLGELHDCDVWIDDLGARLKKTARQAKGDRQTQMSAACTWLLRHFAKQRTEHYCDALRRWQQWEGEGFLDKLKLVLESSK